MAFSGSPISDYAADTKRIGATKAWRLQKGSNWIKSWVRLLIIKFLLQIQLNLHLKASHRCSDPCWGGVGNGFFINRWLFLRVTRFWRWRQRGWWLGNAEDNKNNFQQCDLDEAANMTKSKTMLIVIMPLTRTMCSQVILMKLPIWPSQKPCWSCLCHWRGPCAALWSWWGNPIQLQPQG